MHLDLRRNPAADLSEGDDGQGNPVRRNHHVPVCRYAAAVYGTLTLDARPWWYMLLCQAAKGTAFSHASSAWTSPSGPCHEETAICRRHARYTYAIFLHTSWLQMVVNCHWCIVLQIGNNTWTIPVRFSSGAYFTTLGRGQYRISQPFED